MQAVLPTLLQQGTRCTAVGHNRLDLVEHEAKTLATAHRRVFYLCDGVYRMHGDALDVGELLGVLDRVPQLFAYVDDAHGVGWTGARGAGIVLGVHGLHERMAVTLGLAKGFAAGGAALVFPDRELAERVNTCGGPMIFSGPLQTAQLGAAIASAKITLSPVLDELQTRVRARIQRFEEVAAAERIELASSTPTPIRFVRMSDNERTLGLAERLLAEGYFVNIALYPAVSRTGAGLRLMLGASQELADIEGLLRCLGGLLHDSSLVTPSSS